jgi:hypothetical protein
LQVHHPAGIQAISQQRMLDLAVREEAQPVEQTDGLVHRGCPMTGRSLHGAGVVDWHAKKRDARVLHKWEYGHQAAGMIEWESTGIPWQWVPFGLDARTPQATLSDFQAQPHGAQGTLKAAQVLKNIVHGAHKGPIVQIPTLPIQPRIACGC